MSAVDTVMEVVSNPLFRSVVSGMTGYFIYPQNDALVRIVRRNPWLRHIFLFLLIWQSRNSNSSASRTAIAVAIVYVLVSIVFPALEQAGIL